jgi:hypothetical protein
MRPLPDRLAARLPAWHRLRPVRAAEEQAQELFAQIGHDEEPPTEAEHRVFAKLADRATPETVRLLFSVKHCNLGMPPGSIAGRSG